jgi:hypothetical protein
VAFLAFGWTFRFYDLQRASNPRDKPFLFLLSNWIATNFPTSSLILQESSSVSWRQFRRIHLHSDRHFCANFQKRDMEWANSQPRHRRSDLQIPLSGSREGEYPQR